MSDREDCSCQDLIEQLNENLAGEYYVIAGYATVIALLRAEVTDRQGHARALADSVTALGGQPTAAPSPMPLTHDLHELLAQLVSPQSGAFSTCQKRSPHPHLREDRALLMRLMELAAGEITPRHAAPRAAAPS
jgi:bacterioferritin